MVFVRLAGCSVGCPQCDTDYRVYERLSVDQILQRIVILLTPATEWIWITGGEPADHDLTELLRGIREKLKGIHLAMATSGHKPIPWGGLWLSVSPHDVSKWVVRIGAEIKLVPGLNGVKLDDFSSTFDGESKPQFAYRYVQPSYDVREERVDQQSLQECLEWVSKHPIWRLSAQGHKQWKVE